MDFFPDLGEPGFLDEAFYFGPIVLEVILGLIIFWMLGRLMNSSGLSARIAATVGLVIAVNILLFIAFGLVFQLANPTLS